MVGVGGRWRVRLRVAAALVAWCLLAALGVWRLPGAPLPNAPRRALLAAAPTTPTPPPAAAASSAAPPSHVLSDAEQSADAQRRHPALPLDYWFAHKDDKNKFFERKECAPFPSIYELEYHNTYWQSLRTSNGTFHVWGAYLDVRPQSRLGPAVRVLAVHDRLNPQLATHCQLWFERRAAPVLVRVLEYKYVWNSKWGNYRDGVLQPYLLACVLPGAVRRERPAAVSLVEAACDRATTLVRVHAPPKDAPPQRDFAVCVKGLDFLHEDLSTRLVEWIELVHLLGAQKIFFYELQVHPNISRVLDYYTQRGIVEVSPITLPGGQPNLPSLQHMYLKKKTTHKRQMELIPYNDCLYRHMYEFRWLALLDIDEVIVPLQDADWASLMKRLEPKVSAFRKRATSYHASNVYFLDSLQAAMGPEPGVPPHLHMLQHVYRTRNFTKPGSYVKAFHETGRVLTLHNHFPLACLGGKCWSYPLEREDARLQHYRADCVSSLKKTCPTLRADPVRDTALWRWRAPLVARADYALAELGLLPPHR